MARHNTAPTWQFDSAFLESAISKSVVASASLDEEKDYLCTRAPNAIEWVTCKEYLNQPSLFKFYGAYSAIKEFFELRCPDCNSEDDVPRMPWVPGQASTGLSRDVLESEVLLTWSATYEDDVCPKCRITRSEFVERGTFNNFRVLHAIVGQRCMALDSRIQTSEGLKTFRELLGEGREKDVELPHSMGVYGERGPATSVGVTYAGVKKSVKLTTTLGFNQEVGESHPVRVLNTQTLEREWRKASDLKLGDYLLICQGSELYGKRKLKKGAARLMGYLISDGSVQDPKWVKTSRGAPKFRQALLDLGMPYSNASNKTIPSSVLESCQQDQVDFLRGYFAGDGWAYMASDGVSGQKPNVGCGSISRTLSEQVRLMLLNMGVRASIASVDSVNYNSRIPTGNWFYVVDVMLESIPLFAEKVGIALARKQRTLQDCVNFVRAKDKLVDKLSPINVGLWLRNFLDALRIHLGCTRDARGFLRGKEARLGMPSAKWQSCVRPCWSRDTLSLPRPTAQLVLDAIDRYAPREVEPFEHQIGLLRQYCDQRWLPLKITSLESSETEMADIRVPDGECYVANGILNHNSGKTLTLAQIGTYIEHVACTIAHVHPGGLAGYFGGAKNETYDVGWVASTRNQGEKTIWGKYLDVRANSPWFQRYVPWVKLKEKTQDTPKGMLKWVYDENTKSISNGLARLQIDCLSSNSHANAGGTRLFAAVDEISRMSMTEGYRSGPEVYSTMLASCATIQASVEKYGLVPWLGMIGSISSPYSLDDYGMQLLQQAKVDKRMYSFRRATWDFNPEQPFENFATDLRKDYVKTMRNFGAQPPGAASPLIDRPDDFIKFAVDPTLKPTASFIMYDFVDKVGCEMRGIKLDNSELIVRGTPRYIAADAGANFDAFSVACGHGEYDDNGNVITVFDWVIRLLTKNRSQEVYFESIYQLIKDLQPKVPIKAIEFDHWNSKSIVQRLRDELGLWAEEVAISDDIFLSFMRDAYSGQVRMLPALDTDEGKDPPYMSPQGAAIYELLRLERNEKDKILNPLKGLRRGFNSDDTARCIVHVHKLVQEQGYTLRQDDTSRRARRKRGDVQSTNYTSRGGGSVVQTRPSGLPRGGGGQGFPRGNGGGGNPMGY